MDKKTEVEKWSENYPEFISGFSSFMAVLVEGVSEHLESIKNKSCFNTFGDISPLEKWLECYEDDSFTIKYIGTFIVKRGCKTPAPFNIK